MFEPNLLSLGLVEIGPKRGATSGQPVESAVEIYADANVAIGVWECTPGTFPSEKIGSSEYMCFLSGEATILGEDGTSYEIGPGAAIFLKDGWRGSWEIRRTVRKTYAIIGSTAGAPPSSSR